MTMFLSYSLCPHIELLPFPTRRSSDLVLGHRGRERDLGAHWSPRCSLCFRRRQPRLNADRANGGELLQCRRDRKSTRLNSSHVAISYAVFCLNKKTKYN